MKKATPLSRGLLSNMQSVFVTSLVATMGLHGQAYAVSVDSELVLLVDVSQTGLNKKDFGSLMSSYSSAMSSSEVLNSIQSGTYGRIAVSLILYGDSSFQQVGIPWMSIGNATDAAQFGALAGNLTRPGASGFPNVGSAIAGAAASFGTETGGASNGFESALQIIDVAASVLPNASNAAADTAARNGAMASGVDLINTIALGKQAPAIASYYTTNVIGSTLPGVNATASSTLINATLTAALTTSLTESVGVNVTPIPEPNAAFGVLFGISVFLFRRHRA